MRALGSRIGSHVDGFEIYLDFYGGPREFLLPFASSYCKAIAEQVSKLGFIFKTLTELTCRKSLHVKCRRGKAL